MGKLLYMPDGQQNRSSSQIVTVGDLDEFHTKMLMSIKMLLEGHLNKPAKRWLKSHEVRRLLNISAGTLQTLRNNQKIPFSKMGGMIFYDASEIDQILASNQKLTGPR
jgi:Helix-turn-helix domain